MDRRLIFAMVSASASLGMVVLGAYTVQAANAIASESGLSAPSLHGTVSGSGAQSNLEAAHNAGGSISGEASTGWIYGGVQLAAATEVSSSVLSKAVGSGGRLRLSKMPDGCLRLLSENTDDLKSNHTQSCAVFGPLATKRGRPLAVRRQGTGEARCAPKMALMLGVWF
jgi:hypothetical protein